MLHTCCGLPFWLPFTTTPVTTLVTVVLPLLFWLPRWATRTFTARAVHGAHNLPFYTLRAGLPPFGLYTPATFPITVRCNTRMPLLHYPPYGSYGYLYLRTTLDGSTGLFDSFIAVTHVTLRYAFVPLPTPHPVARYRFTRAQPVTPMPLRFLGLLHAALHALGCPANTHTPFHDWVRASRGRLQLLAIATAQTFWCCVQTPPRGLRIILLLRATPGWTHTCGLTRHATAAAAGLRCAVAALYAATRRCVSPPALLLCALHAR